MYEDRPVVGVPDDLSQPATNLRNEKSTSLFASIILRQQILFRYRFARHDVGGAVLELGRCRATTWCQRLVMEAACYTCRARRLQHMQEMD